jgi:hypothetical protein
MKYFLTKNHTIKIKEEVKKTLANGMFENFYKL